MLNINFYELGSVSDSEIKRVVIISRYKNQWVYCKNKERAWEVPGGHVEEGETPLEAAERELYEETGATKFNIEPVCIYSLSNYATLFYAEIEEFDKLPESEIEKIEFFESAPEDLTFPELHLALIEKTKEFKKLKLSGIR